MKILLADDHALVREGIKLVFRRIDDRAHVLEANDFDETLEIVVKHDDLDLLILDLTMPGAEKFQGLQQISRCRPATPIIVLSASQDPGDVKSALNLGARGYITKSSTNDVILNAMQLVLAGGTYLPLEVLDRLAGPGTLANGDQQPVSRNLAGRFTRRQLEILQCLTQGQTNKHIACTLGISEPTVKAHVTAIYKTLDVSNRAQAVRRAFQLGVVTGGNDNNR